MSIIVYPSGRLTMPREMEWGFRNATRIWTSPHNGETTTIEDPWARLMCTLRFSAIPEADAGPREALFARLRGRANRLQLWNMKRPRPMGSQQASALVKIAAAQGASTIILKSAVAAATLRAGDWFGVGGQVRQITTDATVSGIGEVTLAFESPLRSAVAVDAVVRFDRPSALFILDSDELTFSGLRGGVAGEFSVGLMEVFS